MNYSINKTFADSEVNRIIDTIFYKLDSEFRDEDLTKSFVLTGKAAAILQGDQSKEVENIILICSNATIFSYVQLQLKNYIKPKGAVVFKERVLFYFDAMYLEIWFSNTALNVVNKNNIFLQHIDDINPILL